MGCGEGIATKLRASIARRYEVYDLHSTEASKIASLRQQRAMEFLDASVEIGDRIRNVRNEVREEIAADRQRIKAAFRAEAAQLRFWNVIKHAKASIRYAARLAVHRARLALHPLAMRTMRRRAILRTQLRAEGANFLHTDGILAQAQRAHGREAWIGALRPAAKPQATASGQQAGLAI